MRTISLLDTVANGLAARHCQTIELSSFPTTKVNEFSFFLGWTPGTGIPFRWRLRSGSGCPPPLVQTTRIDCPARAKACPLVDLSESPSTVISRMGGLEGPRRTHRGKKKKENKVRKKGKEAARIIQKWQSSTSLFKTYFMLQINVSRTYPCFSNLDCGLERSRIQLWFR